jgi:glycosyltransferase involved in cell wall biosynthesis
VKRRHQGADDTSPVERVRLEAALARTVDAVVATCADEVTELVALGADRRRIAVVPCGVDVDLFSDSAQPWPRSGRPRLVCIGRLVPRKGIATVIEALPRLSCAELLVAGGPPRSRLETDAEARRLQELASRLGVRERLHMLGGVSRADVPGLLRSADLAVSVPWYEPFGMTTLEAMAVGVPVVASAVGGHLDTVEPGVTGRLVPPKDPDTLAHTVGQLLRDDVSRTAMGLAAAERARSRFAWDRVARETVQVYASVLARRPEAVAS